MSTALRKKLQDDGPDKELKERELPGYRFLGFSDFSDVSDFSDSRILGFLGFLDPRILGFSDSWILGFILGFLGF